jgi:hypothetical protein
MDALDWDSVVGHFESVLVQAVQQHLPMRPTLLSPTASMQRATP